MNIRKLNLDDYDLIEKFFPKNNFIKNGLKNYYLKGEKYTIFGIFDDSILIEFAGVIESEETPLWVLSKTFSFLKLHSNALLDYILKIEEAKKRFQFITIDDRIEVEPNNRYNHYLEHFVPKETFTGYENIDHDVLEYQKFDKDLFIHLWALKNEYRSF
jgi:hypothetical protein